MAVRSKTTLKTYLEAGDNPTQAQFEDLIDTLVAIAESGASFGAGSIPLIVLSGTDAGVVEFNYVGLKSSGGTRTVGMTKDGLQFNNISDYYKMATYPIGTWNMGTTSTKSVDISTEVSTRAKVLGILIKIVSDTGQIYGIRDDLYWSMNTDGTVIITRTGGGFFQSSGNFDATVSSRGEITVIYDPTNV